MRFYNQPHQYYCGVDLHARSMYLHIVDADKRKALAILESKIGRAVYQVWCKQQPFDAQKFLHS